jgi:periplasmic copper chaperone A
MNSSVSRHCARNMWAIPLLCLLSPWAAASPPPTPVIAGDLVVSAVWARATIASTPVGAVYFTVTNRGQQVDTLLGATSPVAAEATLHRSVHANGMASMHAATGVAIAPGQAVKAEPGGLHLMLVGLNQPLAAGMRIPLTLQFRRTGTVDVQAWVIPMSAPAPASKPAQKNIDHATR